MLIILSEVHSLYSEQVVLTPILKLVSSEFSPLVREITNTYHDLLNNSCPKSPQKGEIIERENYIK